MFPHRQGLAVWLHSLKPVKQLRKYGNVHYISKKMKYAIIYCDQERIEELTKRLESLSFVKRVDKSMKPFVKTEYQNAMPDKAKAYDYKMGL